MRIRFMPNRNTSKPLKYPLAATIIARNKRFLLTEFYQGIRMQSHGADIFSNACRDTDSLQKRMSLQAMVPVSNGRSHGLICTPNTGQPVLGVFS